VSDLEYFGCGSLCGRKSRRQRIAPTTYDTSDHVDTVRDMTWDIGKYMQATIRTKVKMFVDDGLCMETMVLPGADIIGLKYHKIVDITCIDGFEMRFIIGKIYGRKIGVSMGVFQCDMGNA
jgi:hypothetical protein